MASGSWRKRIMTSFRRSSSSTDSSVTAAAVAAPKDKGSLPRSKTKNKGVDDEDALLQMLPVTLQESSGTTESLSSSVATTNFPVSLRRLFRSSDSSRREDDPVFLAAPSPIQEEKSRNSSLQTESHKDEQRQLISPITEKEVYDFVWEYMETFTEVAQYPEGLGSSQEAWDAFWSTYHTDDYCMVRPSGNTLDRDGLRALFDKGIITQFSDQVLAVELIKLLSSTSATVVFTSCQEYHCSKAQQEPAQTEEHFCTWTAILVKDEHQQLRITNIHRSLGRNMNEVVHIQRNEF